MGYTLTIPAADFKTAVNVRRINNSRITNYLEFLTARYTEPHDFGNYRSQTHDGLGVQSFFTDEEIDSLDASDIIKIACNVDEFEEDEDFFEQQPVTVIITPLFMQKVWQHSDDYIDNAEWFANAKRTGNHSLAPQIQSISSSSLFPYDGLHMDGRTGKEFTTSNSVHLVWQMKNNPPSGKFVKSESNHLLEIIQRAGFASWAEFDEFYVPAVPGVVRDLIDWLELFEDENAWMKLRPNVVTYWS